MIERLLPEAASAHAAMLDAVLLDVHWHALAVFVVWSVILVAALVRFREGRSPEPRAAGPGILWPAVAIAAVVLGDVVLLATRALPAWNARTAPPAAGVEAPLEIHVAAEQFAWNIHYPGPDGRFGRTDTVFIGASNPVGIDRGDPAAADDIGLVNLLVLPLGRTVVVQLTSRDVVHSFTLPQMRVKQDAIPGLTARTWFTPTALGAWEIGCSQLCGLGHYRMRGDYRVLPRDEWAEWQAEEVSRLR
ncbi:MAG: cytochrome c oxidase subunit II [Vicinamibacterales bacterium]